MPLRVDSRLKLGSGVRIRRVDLGYLEYSLLLPLMWVVCIAR